MSASSGERDSCALLLAWARSEWQVLGYPSTLRDFGQLRESPFLYALLQQVHPSHFAELNHLACQYRQYLTAIQEYLAEQEGRYLRRAYRRRLES